MVFESLIFSRPKKGATFGTIKKVANKYKIVNTKN